MRRFLQVTRFSRIWPAFALVAGFSGLVYLLGWGMWQLAPEPSLPPEAAESDREAITSAAREVGTPTVGEWPADRPRRFAQAPEFDKAEEQGRLPPVAERLPENPLVIHPPEQNGPYGGTWTRYASGPNDISIFFSTRLTYEGLVRWDARGREVIPNLATHWEIEDDGRTFTFHLRRGVRWSDGHPFTSEDILFWYESVLLDEHLTPGIPGHFIRGGELMKLEAPDDHTIRFRFAEPDGIFLERLASGVSTTMVAYPKHYLKRFHRNYVDEGTLREKTREAGFSHWYELFYDKYDWQNRALPALTAWVISRPPPGSPVTFRRNPYYWKVDSEGNQLPYIDEVGFHIFDNEIIALRVLQGGVGMQGRHISLANLPLLMEHRREGGYQVRTWEDSGGGALVLAPNLNHRDPVMAGILNDRRFRIALSTGVDRDTLNRAGFFDLGTPRQVAPPPASAFYSPEYESAHLEHDPAEANRLLDGMGLEQRNKHGIRLRPDGRPLRLQIETTQGGRNHQMLQLVADDWQNLGIDAEVRRHARQLFTHRVSARMHDVAVWSATDTFFPLIGPGWFFPFDAHSYHAADWGRWFQTHGSEGEEPPPLIRRCMDLYREIEYEIDPERRIEMFREIIELNRENLWVIGTIGDLPQIHIVSDTFRNVPSRAMAGWIIRTPGNTAPECYAIDPGGPDLPRTAGASR